MNISLYIHIPFCKTKCPYCSFVSFGAADESVGLYLEALKKEAAFYKGRSVSTIYIGGGTPTYLGQKELEFLFEIIRSHFKIDQLREWTVEANPATFDFAKAVFLRNQGVSRVSLGIQSFDESFLRFLGRPYTKDEAVRAYTVLRQAGFENLSVDLMYGFPSQSEKELASDVDQLLALKSEHVSLYGLTVSCEAAFYRNGIVPLDDDRQGDYYRRLCACLAQAGWTQYEVSNFAKKGYESRHNLNYWEGGDYIGLGLGAHSHLDGARFWNTSDLVSYGESLEKGVLPCVSRETLPADKKFLEVLLIGLRMSQGVDVAELEARFGVRLCVHKRFLIDDFAKKGLLEWDAGRLKASISGMPVLDEICSKII